MMTLIVSLFLSLTTHADTFTDYRDSFKAANVPTTYDLHMSTWECKSQVDFGDREREFGGKWFYFVVVPHNNRMLFSNDSTLPQWLPRWFSEYQGMRTSVALWTNDFMTECLEGDLSECMKEEQSRKNWAYLRLTKEQELWIEWTTTPHDDLVSTPVSVDTEETDQRVWMYSRCVQI